MKLLFVSAITFFINLFVMAQENDRGKVTFINAFTRYMEWPDNSKNGFFTIGVYGSFDMYKLISKETMGRSVGNQNVVVVNLYSEDQLGLTKFHMLLIGKDYCDGLFIKKVSNRFSRSSTLIIAEENGIEHGAGIDFTYTGSSLSFHYNSDIIKKQGIMMSKQLMSKGKAANL